jgi:hypothetical protein
MRTKPSVLMTAFHLISTKMRSWALVMARNPCFFDVHQWPREALFTNVVVAQVCSPWARVLMLCALRCRTRSDGFHRLVCPPHIPNLSSFGDLVFWFSIAHQLHSAKSLPRGLISSPFASPQYQNSPPCSHDTTYTHNPRLFTPIRQPFAHVLS